MDKIKEIISRAMSKPSEDDRKFFIVNLVDVRTGISLASGVIKAALKDTYEFSAAISETIHQAVADVIGTDNIHVVESKQDMFEDIIDDKTKSLFHNDKESYTVTINGSQIRVRHDDSEYKELSDDIQLVITFHYFDERQNVELAKYKAHNEALRDELGKALREKYEITHGMFCFLTEQSSVRFDIDCFEVSANRLIERLEKYKAAEAEED